MGDGNILRKSLRGDFLDALTEIFEAAHRASDENTLAELHSELDSVLQRERDFTFLFHRGISPSGTHHILVIDNLCLLVNVYGIHILLDDWRFFDGELDILNFHWIEEDHLVLFDVYHIVRDQCQKCICHFSRNDFFAYLTPVLKENACTQNKIAADVPPEETFFPPDRFPFDDWI